MRLVSSLAGIALTLAAGAALAADTDFSFDRGLRIRFPSADTELRFGGRLHLDYAHFDDDLTTIDDDFDVRRGRTYLEARFGDDWKAKVEYDFAFDRGWRAAWIQWDVLPQLELRLGNQLMPFGQEVLESSNDLVFAERSLGSSFAPLYGTGLVASTHGRAFRHSAYTWAAGAYVEPFADSDYDFHQSEHVGFATRATFDPIARRRRVVHFGGSFEYRSVGGDREWGVARKPESFLAPILFVAALGDVDKTLSFGAEAALMFGPLMLRGEYMHASVDRSTAADPGFDGAYLQASWVVTGERHRYSRSRATFGGVRPRSDWGALELGVRFSMLDLTDAGVLGGEAEDITAGVSWWLRENLRLMFNYVHVDAKQSGTLLSDDPQIFQLRFIYHL